MGEFDWDSMGWSDWNTPDSYNDTGSDFDWGSVDYGGGWDSGGSDWGSDPWWSGGGGGGGSASAGSIDWGSTGWSDWNSPGTGYTSGEGNGISFTDGGFSSGQGSFGQGGFDTGAMAGAEWDAPTAGNAGVTGAMGVDPSQEQNSQETRASLLSMGPQTQSDAALGQRSLQDQWAQYERSPGKAVSEGFASVRKFGKENADLARLGIGVAGMLAARGDQKRSDRLMEQTLADRERERQMKEELYKAQLANMHRASGQSGAAHRSQASAVSRNNAQADFWNKQAQTSANEARSLYNPQELGVRGYAQEQAATGRSVQDIRDKMSRQGKSQSSIDSEVRRAKVAGSTNATTGFMKGLDTGRTAQTGALSAAKGLGSSYSALGPVSIPGVSVPSMGSNSDLAQYYSGQAGDNSNAIQDLLNYYLGNPLGQSNDNNTR